MTHFELVWELFQEWLSCKMADLFDTVLVEWMKEMNRFAIFGIPRKEDVLLLKFHFSFSFSLKHYETPN